MFDFHYLLDNETDSSLPNTHRLYIIHANETLNKL